MKASRLRAFLFGLLIVFALCELRAADPFAVHAVRELGFDQLQRLKPRRPGAEPVRVVDIDEASLAAYGQWPWPRDRLAHLTDRLDKLGAAAIVYDVAFAEADRLSPSRLASEDNLKSVLGPDAAALARLRDNDELFAQALARSPAVLGFGMTGDSGGVAPSLKAGFAVTGNRPLDAVPVIDKVTPVIAPLAAAAQGLGSMSLTPGQQSGIVRTIPLMLQQAGKPYPALVLEALRVAQGATTYIIRGSSDEAAIMEDIRIGDFTVPVTRDGQMWVYYRYDDPGLFVSVKRVLDGGDDAALKTLIEGQIVFVGASAVGLHDSRTTALGEILPGVAIHAQAAEQIIAGTFLARPDWADGAEFIASAAVGLMLVASTLYLGPLMSMAMGAGALAAMVGAVWLAFVRAGLLLDVTFPAFAAAVVFLSMTAYRFFVSDRERRFVRGAFSRYVSPSVLAQIQQDPGRLKLGGEVREITVMFSDVRGFTPISEKLDPEELVVFLNQLLGEMSRRVMARDGTVDKYIGDALMAFWNAPLDIAGHEEKACLATLDMRRVLREMTESDAFGFKDKGLSARIGIGLNTGQAVAGNLGSAERFDYSCIGDAVNVASRVESASKDVGFDILVTSSVANAAPNLAFLDAGTIGLKGKSNPVPIFILLGDAEMARSAEFRALKQRHDVLMARRGEKLAKDIEAEFKALADEGEVLVPGLAQFYEALAKRREGELMGKK